MNATKTTNHTTITNLSDLLRSGFYDSFRGDKLGNDLFITDAERAERINRAAEDGCDGSTHAEAIEDMREANEIACREVYRKQFESYGDIAQDLAEVLRFHIDGEIDDTEAYHEKAGTLHNQIG